MRVGVAVGVDGIVGSGVGVIGRREARGGVGVTVGVAVGVQVATGVRLGVGEGVTVATMNRSGSGGKD